MKLLKPAFIVYALGFQIGCTLKSTDSWPTTGCAVVGSRVVRDNGPHREGALMVLYAGEYQVRYTANGKPYYLWVSAGWVDKEREFVESKVSALPESCPYVISYNPKNPAEAVARGNR